MPSARWSRDSSLVPPRRRRSRVYPLLLSWTELRVLACLPSRYAVRNVEDTTLIVFTPRDRLRLLGSRGVWRLERAAIQDRTRLLAERRDHSVAVEDPRTRYRRFLEEVIGIERRVGIARYLGMTPGGGEQNPRPADNSSEKYTEVRDSEPALRHDRA